MKNQLILGDNLEVLKKMPSESVDLIYIDPPFFSKRHYEVIWGDKGEVASFNDRWAGGINHYIGWLCERVEELYRVLKPTGSFYLHCDWHANAYIRVNILDKIFGDKNFVNEIVWCYSNSGRSREFFSKKHDSIFLYRKTENVFWNYDYKIPYSGSYIRSHFRDLDEQKGPCRKRFDAGKWRIYYPDEGMIPNDWWPDISSLNSMAKERIGYPTQKPEALLERIIKASSNPGDIVLDAFVGGGTTVAVARRLGRKFIGIDQSVRAIAVSNARLENQTDLLIDDVYEIKTEKYDYDKLFNMDPFKFETFIIEQFGGIPNIKQRNDQGKDGIKRENGVTLPIQVKQQKNVGRPQMQNFIGFLVQNKMARGFFIAFDFAKTAYEYVAEVKQNIGIEVTLVKVEDIIQVAKKPKIKLDWSYETIEEQQHVTFVATGDEIELWQWDWDYDEAKGFAAEVLKDTSGMQTIVLKNGKNEIAVRGIDQNGIDTIETLTLYSNGSVHG